jgi:hypothetical protein
VAEHEPGGTPFSADAARKLILAVQDWARETFPAGPDGHSGPECQWCPLCQFAAVLRGEHPEVADRVAEAGAALMSAVQALAQAATSRPGGAPQPPRVQRIDLGPSPE